MDGREHGSRADPWLVVVMGVSGAGKTTVGILLARRAGVSYVDGDALHSAANIEKMARGEPLTDADREPWLDAVAAHLRAHAASGAVVSCSALRRAYRDVLVRSAPGVVFLHLTGGAEVLEKRLARRTNHFMPVSMLASQLATLEPLAADERGVVLDVSATPEQLVDAFVERARTVA